MITRKPRPLVSIIMTALFITPLGLPARSVPPKPAFFSQGETFQAATIYIDPYGTMVQGPIAEPGSQIESCALPAPTLVSPINEVLVSSLVPSFLWTGTGTDKYWLQISVLSDFSTYIYDTSWSGFSGDSVTLSLDFNLASSTTYYWRVASLCNDFSAGEFSVAASFSTAEIGGPFIDPPAMISPADGELLTSLEVTFTWGDVPGAAGWQLRLYNTLSDAQNDIPFSRSWSSRWRNWTLRNLSYPRTVYWRILVRDDTAWGSLSPIRRVTVGVPPWYDYLPIIQR